MIGKFSYGLFIDVNQFTVAAEIFPVHLRSQAVSIASTSVFLSDVLWLELEPTAQERIGWKYYLVFACLGLAHTVYLYFYLPEVSGSLNTHLLFKLTNHA